MFAKYGKIEKILTNYSYEWIETEVKYSDSTGKGIIIQNSFPKGGMGYTDPTGKNFNYVVFWTRVINEFATPLELTINFSADSSAILPSPYAYLFLPPDTMTLVKESLFDYGLTSLKSILDAGTNKPTKLRRTINPKQECLFYIGVLIKMADADVNAPARAGLFLKGQQLLYSIRGISRELNSALIPCGNIIFK